jgi:hypothetical protein
VDVERLIEACRSAHPRFLTRLRDCQATLGWQTQFDPYLYACMDEHRVPKSQMGATRFLLTYCAINLHLR